MFLFSYHNTCSRQFKWLVQLMDIETNRSSIHEGITQKPWNILFIFSYKGFGYLPAPIGNSLCLYLPQGSIIVKKSPMLFLSLIWKFPIFKSSGMAYWHLYKLGIIYCVLVIGYGLHLIWLFNFLKSLSKCTLKLLGLDCSNDVALP